MTKSKKPMNSLGRRILPDEEKIEFIQTSVSWISGKDIMETCFVLNFGYEVPLPWPQVKIFDISKISKCSIYVSTKDILQTG